MLREYLGTPEGILSTRTDIFGQELEDSPVRSSLQNEPADNALFARMMKACVTAAIDVLERQYKVYFSMEVTDTLMEQTATARTHNIDSEELMGMFSAIQQQTPAATLCYISSKIRAKKNRTVDYLDSLEPRTLDNILKVAVI